MRAGAGSKGREGASIRCSCSLNCSVPLQTELVAGPPLLLSPETSPSLSCPSQRLVCEERRECPNPPFPSVRTHRCVTEQSLSSRLGNAPEALISVSTACLDERPRARNYCRQRGVSTAYAAAAWLSATAALQLQCGLCPRTWRAALCATGTFWAKRVKRKELFSAESMDRPASARGVRGEACNSRLQQLFWELTSKPGIYIVSSSGRREAKRSSKAQEKRWLALQFCKSPFRSHFPAKKSEC